MRVPSRVPKLGESLADLFPAVAAQWHPTKNGELTPKDVRPFSEKRVWWKCDLAEDHEWESRVRNRGCPFCSGLKVSVTNSLATLFPAIAAQWHPTKNGGLNANQVVAGSTQKIWWKCDVAEDHEWETKLVNRTHRNRGCPACAGRQVSVTNSLASLLPEIAEQWHPTKNGGLRPEDVTSKSDKKVWWKCDAGEDHEWESKVANSDCPFCRGYQVSVTNSLAALFPAIAEQWHPTKNGEVTPQDVTYGTHDRAWWKCDVADDHEWETTVVSRTHKETGCPACKGKQVSVTNSLANVFPEIAAQWHPTRNDDLTPSDVTSGANKRVWWKCEVAEDHEWLAPIPGRTSHGHKCPACTGQQVSVTNSLLSLYPDLARSWHPTKNGELTPAEVTAGTPKKVWWTCQADNSHEWQASISSRTGRNRSCPMCTLTPRSGPEIRLAYELSALINFDVNQHKVKVMGSLRDVDIVIEPLKLVVEYDGAFWHSDKKDKDRLKTNQMETDGWKIIRVREYPLESIHENDVMIPKSLDAKEIANRVVTRLSQITDSDIPQMIEYLESQTCWREEEALAAIRAYQAERAAAKAERAAKKAARSSKKI